MSDTANDFAAFLKERERTSTAYVNGDFAPLRRVSTTHSPATIFGPKGDCIQGADKVNAANEAGAAHFEAGSDNRFEIMHYAADGDLGWWVGVQRSHVRIKGQDEPVSFDLRVTELFRREGGQWKLVHRHADKLAQA